MGRKQTQNDITPDKKKNTEDTQAGYALNICACLSQGRFGAVNSALRRKLNRMVCIWIAIFKGFLWLWQNRVETLGKVSWGYLKLWHNL